jgi:pyruvate/2-oxoglutarate dehydrogenase complex dihydrolipoamide dehydrogenase (E3) component
MERYNVVVIGGGSAGLLVAAGAAGLGAKVALVEEGKMGGDCLNTGCVPSKALIRSAHTAALKAGALHGLPAAPVRVEWPAVRARVQEVIGAIAPHDSVERFTAIGVDVLQGRGRLVSATGVAVALNGGGTRTLEGRSVVIATGSRAAVPPIAGLKEAGYLTNETVFTMPTLPARLAVIGGGPIGLELGQSFARLGSQVTVVEALPRLLPREDEDVAALIAGVLRREGIVVHTGAKLTKVESGSFGKRLTLETGGAPLTLDVDDILVAVGRAPIVQGLGLEEVGVRFERGGVAVNDKMQSNLPSVYACGDVAGPYLFTHMANQQARVVIQNALFPVKARIRYRVVPWCTFTDPEVAHVGLSEDDARRQGLPFRALRMELSEIDRAVCDGATEGFLKVLTPPGQDTILGATLVGAHAGELIHEIVLAMQAKLRLRDLANTIHCYPTLAEVFRRIGDESRKAGFTPRAQALVRGFLAWQRR